MSPTLLDAIMEVPMGDQLVSAIPPHLAVERTRPTSEPDGFRVPFPSFAAWQAPEVRQVVMAYFGAQQEPGALDLDGPDAPRHHDRAEPVDGPPELITVAYWDDPAAFDRWFDRHRDPWVAAPGRWIEVVRPTVERFETILGHRRHPHGVATLAERFSDPIREHGYWGSMRDRLPAAQTDEVDDPAPLEVESSGDVVRVRPRGSLCLIRSGQDWSGTDDAERALYLDDVEPSLRAGMDFLSSDGASIGCLHNRYLRIVDDAGAATDRTYGMSWWRTLGDLETWAASHPTHLRIFGAFGRLVRQQGERTRLRLYHEVTVATPEQQWFAYHRCRPGTGLLIADPARPA